MTIKVESDKLQEGLLGLVVALVEIITEVLQKQAIYRLESNTLREEEAEKLGQAFIQLDQTINKIKQEHGLEKTTSKIRSDLDHLVSDAVHKLIPLEQLNNEIQNAC